VICCNKANAKHLVKEHDISDLVVAALGNFSDDGTEFVPLHGCYILEWLLERRGNENIKAAILRAGGRKVLKDLVEQGPTNRCFLETHEEVKALANELQMKC